MSLSTQQNIVILGSTGSIGTQTLDVISCHPKLFSVFALSAKDNVKLLFSQCRFYKPRYAVISKDHYNELKTLFKNAKLSTKLLCGPQALADIASHSKVDKVVAAIVGGAGLYSIHAAVNSGKQILLANKESLVMTGDLLLQTAKRTGAVILPLDSEHNALFQCLPNAQRFREKSLSDAGISRLVLTGSGGPFRKIPIAKLADKTPDEACNHPNWIMGKKISVDSATMMNKGLEYIEAKLLFAAQDHQLGVIIHPQSIIHSLVQYKDGSSLAQIGYSDMKISIAHALGYPKRIQSGVDEIDLFQYNFSFEQVDYRRYPCLQLAISLANDNIKTTVMNAANEVAVTAFLKYQIGFMQIYDIVNECISLDFDGIRTINCIDDVLHLDNLARLAARKLIY